MYLRFSLFVYKYTYLYFISVIFGNVCRTIRVIRQNSTQMTSTCREIRTIENSTYRGFAKYCLVFNIPYIVAAVCKSAAVFEKLLF